MFFRGVIAQGINRLRTWMSKSTSLCNTWWGWCSYLFLANRFAYRVEILCLGTCNFRLVFNVVCQFALLKHILCGSSVVRKHSLRSVYLFRWESVIKGESIIGVVLLMPEVATAGRSSPRSTLPRLSNKRRNVRSMVAARRVSFSYLFFRFFSRLITKF